MLDEKKTIVLLAFLSSLLPMSYSYADECDKLETPSITYVKNVKGNKDASMPLFTNEVLTLKANEAKAMENGFLEWDFGDGSAVERGNETKHQFKSQGLFTVTLKAGKLEKDKKVIECYGKPSTVDVIVYDKDRTCSCSNEIPPSISDNDGQEVLIPCIKSLRAEIHKLEEKSLFCDRHPVPLFPSSYWNCEIMLGSFEDKLRNQGDVLLEDIKRKEAAKTEIKGIEKAETNAAKEKAKAAEESIDRYTAKAKAKLEEIKKTIPFNGDDLYQTFDDYDQIYARFNLGYEFTSVDTVFKKGAPRAGFMLYMTNEDRMPASYSGFSFTKFHSSFTAQITSSAEQETKISTKNPPTLKNQGNHQALEFDIPVFWALYHSARFKFGNTSRNDKMWMYWGPIFDFGGKKTNVDSDGNPVHKVDLRRYGGLRFAFNPEFYTDIMWGRTTGLHQRLEVRGQLPVYRLENGSRLFLGAIGNFMMPRKKDVNDEADVVRIYLTWNVDFMDVYNYFSGGSKQ